MNDNDINAISITIVDRGGGPRRALEIRNTKSGSRGGGRGGREGTGRERGLHCGRREEEKKKSETKRGVGYNPCR